MSYLAVIFINLAILTSCTILAIVFNHWWIIIFGLLSLYSCKKHSAPEDKESQNEATIKEDKNDDKEE